MRLLEFISHIRLRRRALREHYGNIASPDFLEESCVPSYCHRNIIASGVAWWRLFSATSLYRKHASRGRVLDFGSATGELLPLLEMNVMEYHFIEQNTQLSVQTGSDQVVVIKEELSRLPVAKFDAIFCLDSLEHNLNIEEILDYLNDALAGNGILIVSGPTENVLYQLGRRMAGFSGHYHMHDIYEIEILLGRKFLLLDRVIGPFALPLFSITAWKRRAA